jgi:hypothetical protein
MDIPLTGGIYAYNHTFQLSLPGSANLEAQNITVKNDGEYSIYVRCEDANGNYNPANFVFNYCIDKGPDTTPPLIVGTSTINGAPIAYNTTSWDLTVYTNEPVEMCKWSHRDQSYDKMEYNMTCYSGLFEQNAQMLYRCEVTLNGLKDDFNNKFYFRCKDLAENTNTESYVLSLLGTKPLVIQSVEPNGTIKDATENVQVDLEAETFGGYKDGESICYYKELEENGEEVTSDYIQFFDTSSYTHKQELWLPQGDYKYSIKCVDLGGNTDSENVTFKVESDYAPPLIVRAYHEDPNLVVITDEKSECVYDTTDCTYKFEDGISMNVVDGTIHYSGWETQNTMYIKCKDVYGKEPAPDQCSIIVSPYD